jgi:hypothetical protein
VCRFFFELVCVIYQSNDHSGAEYGAGNMVVSAQGDVYSYGILALETVTGERPTDSTFRQVWSLREYVDVALQKGPWKRASRDTSFKVKDDQLYRFAA